MRLKKPSDNDFRYPQPISGLVDKLMANLGLSRRYDGWRVVKDWVDIVGSTLAARARAIRYAEGVLYIAVEDDSWRQELSMQLETILDEIHRRPYGRAVQEIHFESGLKRN
ncbi:MAG TPA: DUF721 domain-containing protein [candidate division Zixibacteria bacterium]|nr:DUF721 domain-containing protein [candidate division Zixibacteria bacterium]